MAISLPKIWANKDKLWDMQSNLLFAKYVIQNKTHALSNYKVGQFFSTFICNRLTAWYPIVQGTGQQQAIYLESTCWSCKSHQTYFIFMTINHHYIQFLQHCSLTHFMVNWSSVTIVQQKWHKSHIKLTATEQRLNNKVLLNMARVCHLGARASKLLLACFCENKLNPYVQPFDNKTKKRKKNKHLYCNFIWYKSCLTWESTLLTLRANSNISNMSSWNLSNRLYRPCNENIEHLVSDKINLPIRKNVKSPSHLHKFLNQVQISITERKTLNKSEWVDGFLTEHCTNNA